MPQCLADSGPQPSHGGRKVTHLEGPTLGGYPRGGTLQGGTEHFEMAFAIRGRFWQIGDGGGDGPPIPGKSGMGPPPQIPGNLKSGMGMGMGIGGSVPRAILKSGAITGRK